MKSYREKENERKTVRDDCNLQRYLLFLNESTNFKTNKSSILYYYGRGSFRSLILFPLKKFLPYGLRSINYYPLPKAY